MLTFETIEVFETRFVFVRMWLWEDMFLRVIDGIVRLMIDGDERCMGIGEEVIFFVGILY